MSAKLILLGTGCSGGTPNLIYPEVAKGQPERGHPCALYIAEDGKGYLIDAPGTIRQQLKPLMDEAITQYKQAQNLINNHNLFEGFTVSEYHKMCGTSPLLAFDFILESVPTYNGEDAELLKPTHINIEGAIFTHHDDDHINGLTYLRDIVVVNEQSLPVYAPEATLDYLKEHFAFPFNDAMTIYKNGVPVVLKFEGTGLVPQTPVMIADNLPLEITMVRHGNPKKLAAALALPGLVYAPDISHFDDDLLDLIARTQPDTVVLNLQREVRPDDNYPYLGIKEFLEACKKIADTSPNTRRVVSMHMSTLIPSDENLQILLDAERVKFDIPQRLNILVGHDGARFGMHVPQVAPAARLDEVTPSGPRPEPGV